MNIEDVWQHTQGPTSLVELAMEQKATNVALVQHHHYLCLILHSMLVLSLKSVKPMSLFDTKVRYLVLGAGLTLSYSQFRNQNVHKEIPFFIRNQYSSIARKRSNTTAIIVREKYIFSESLLNALPSIIY